MKTVDECPFVLEPFIAWNYLTLSETLEVNVVILYQQDDFIKSETTFESAYVIMMTFLEIPDAASIKTEEISLLSIPKYIDNLLLTTLIYMMDDDLQLSLKFHEGYARSSNLNRLNLIEQKLKNCL